MRYAFILYALIYQFRFLYDDYFYIIRLASLLPFFFLVKSRISSTLFVYIILLSIFLLHGNLYNAIPLYIRLLLFLIFAFTSQKVTLKELKTLFWTIFCVITLASITQVLTGNMVIKTSVLRLTSFYGDNATGFSLLCTQMLLINEGWSEKLGKNHPKVLMRFIFLIFILLSQSRLALGVIALYFLLDTLRAVKFSVAFFIRFLFGAVSLSGILLFIMQKTTLLDRIIDSFVYSFQDASTQARLIAWDTVTNSMTLYERLYGIGLGRFHVRFYNLSGVEGMDAHMDWIKFYAEGGILLIVLWLLVLRKCLKRSAIGLTKDVQGFTRTFIIFNIFLLSSLHNVYFYILTPIIGMYFINSKIVDSDNPVYES